jgi:hypothetical protein
MTLDRADEDTVPSFSSCHVLYVEFRLIIVIDIIWPDQQFSLVLSPIPLVLLYSSGATICEAA